VGGGVGWGGWVVFFWGGGVVFGGGAGGVGVGVGGGFFGRGWGWWVVGCSLGFGWGVWGLFWPNLFSNHAMVTVALSILFRHRFSRAGWDGPCTFFEGECWRGDTFLTFCIQILSPDHQVVVSADNPPSPCTGLVCFPNPSGVFLFVPPPKPPKTPPPPCIVTSMSKFFFLCVWARPPLLRCLMAFLLPFECQLPVPLLQ